MHSGWGAVAVAHMGALGSRVAVVTPRRVCMAGLGQDHFLAVLAVRTAPQRMGGQSRGPTTSRTRQTRSVRHHLVAWAIALGASLVDFLHQVVRGTLNHGHAGGVAKCAQLTFCMHLLLG